MIVTIDGPAGSGKSTAARALARKLGFSFLDTGSMYRAVALAAQRAGLPFDPPDALLAALPHWRIAVEPGRVFLDGEDVSDAIRAPLVSQGASRVAAIFQVRLHLVALQREFARNRSIVTEGRDQGTFVFPEAERKFFLVADPEERARRRVRDLEQRGEAVSFEAILRAQEERDARDAARDLAPMRPADDALVLDSTRLTMDQVVDFMEHEVRRWLDGSRAAFTS